MGEEHHPLVDQALEEWQARETRALERLGLSRSQLLEEFKSVRVAFSEGATLDKRRVRYLGDTLHSVVWNISWVSLFAWMLPRALPRRSDVIDVGEVMLAIFYLETVYKHVLDDMSDDSLQSSISKLEARLRLLHEARESGNSGPENNAD